MRLRWQAGLVAHVRSPCLKRDSDGSPHHTLQSHSGFPSIWGNHPRGGWANGQTKSSAESTCRRTVRALAPTALVLSLWEVQDKLQEAVASVSVPLSCSQLQVNMLNNP